MDPLTKRLQNSPVLARVVPFAVFLGLTFCQGRFGAGTEYWFYLGKTLVGAWLVWSTRKLIPELKWALSWEAIVAGVTVLALWVGLDSFYPHFAPGKPGADWKPQDQFGDGSPLAILFIAVRIIGSSLVVPPLEEVFYRSFLYRYIIKVDFLSVPLGRFDWRALLATSLIFGFEHSQWLAGILCGLIFQALVLRKNRLGDALTAHALTNFLLGLWVIWRGAWQFW